MENTRIKAERKCHRKVKTILREINVGIQNEIYLLCMFPAGVWLCTVDQWMSGAPLAFFYGGIFRAFCDLRQWEKRGSGGCDQGGHGGLDDREQENAQKEGWQTHIKRDERRGWGSGVVWEKRESPWEGQLEKWLSWQSRGWLSCNTIKALDCVHQLLYTCSRVCVHVCPCDCSSIPLWVFRG